MSLGCPERAAAELPVRRVALGAEWLSAPQVRWLIAAKHARDEKEALALGNLIADLGLIEHVTRDHVFKNEHLFYHFTPHCFARSVAAR